MKNIFTKTVSFVLIAAMLIPLVPIAVFAGDEGLTYFQREQLEAWLNMAELEPYDDDCLEIEPLEWEDYAELRLLDLLSRMEDEFDSFTAEEQHIIQEHLGMIDDPMLPEELEELVRAQEEYLARCWLERERSELATLLGGTASFSALDEDSRALIFRQLDIAYEAFGITDELFILMEHNGHTLADSAELIKIMSTGLFDYEEARSIFEAIPESRERLAAIAHFEEFARNFDIAGATNERRLANGLFTATNSFNEAVDIRVGDDSTDFNVAQLLEVETQIEMDGLRRGEFSLENALEIRPWSNENSENVEIVEDYSTIYAIFRAFTSASAFDEAHRMFLDGHSVTEIEIAFALGAALQVEPETFMLQPGIYSGVASPTDLQSRAAQLDGERSIYPFDAELLMDVADADNDELEQIIAYGKAVMNFGIAPTSTEITHETIVSNPFTLGFNANESVILNTGAVVYRKNILSLPGRGGFGLNLDLVYNSANANLRSSSVGIVFDWAPGGGWFIPREVNATAERRDLHGLGVGWMFDLPYIHSNVLYLPGRGTFELTGNTFRDRTLQDMQLTNDTSFVSGSLRSERRLRFHDGTRYYFHGAHIIGMVDRFNNTIRFEYSNVSQFGNLRLLTRIVDSNSRAISFTYGASGNNRTITVTSPDGGSYVINMSRIPGHSGNSDFRIDSVRNQVNATTSFVYAISESRFNFFSKSPWYLNHTALLSQVTYPSGAQLLFGYAMRNTNLGQNGAHQKWSVNERMLRNIANGRDYQRTTFSYVLCFTAYPQRVGRPPANHTYTVTVSQNNGLRTVYTFNYRHLNTAARTYNVNTLLSRQAIVYNNNSLPIIIVLTEYSGVRARATTRLFNYNNYGQVERRISPLAQGVNNIAQYWTDYVYDNRFGLLTRRTTRPNATTTVEERNVLSADGRSIVRSYIYENNVRQSRTDFYRHDAYGNVTVIREFPDSRGSAFIETQITYSLGTMPSRIRTIGVRDASSNLVVGTGYIDRNFTYDAKWRVLTETDPNRYITRRQYDGVGRITRIDFPNGGFVTYAYNNTTNTVTHRTVLGATYIYRYDPLGNLLTVTANNVVILTNTYDNRMRLTDTRTAQGIASSQRTTFSYDIFDRVTEERHLNSAGGIMHRVTTAYFDINDASLNSRITTTVHGDTNAPNIVTFVQYDRWGRRNQEGVNGGRIVTYTHDLAGRVTRETSLGVDNTFTYNVFGMISVRNIESNTARNVYDGMGRLTRSSDFMGNYTRFTYDALGRLTRRDMPFERSGNTVRYASTRYFYDRNGNITRSESLTNLPGTAEQWAGTENTFRHNNLTMSRTGGANGIRTDYTYDLAGNVVTKRVGGTSATAGGAVTTFTYNNRGQLTGIRDALSQDETFTYDLNGLLLTRTDRNGMQFEMFYDNMGRFRSEQAFRNGVYVTSRAVLYTATNMIRARAQGQHSVSYHYDAQGRMIRKTESIGSEVVVHEYAYNAANNRTRFLLRVNGVYQFNKVYTYDAAQRLERMSATMPRVTYRYNANGQVIWRQLGDGAGFSGVVTEYTRNLAGLVTRIDHNHRETELGRAIYRHYLDGNVQNISEILNGVWRNVTYSYDAARRLVREHTIGHAVIGTTTRDYTFDARGNRTRMTVMVTGTPEYTVTYTYDLNNRLTREVRTGSGAGTTTYTYDRNGNQLTRVSGGVTETSTYNAWNQLTRVAMPGMTAYYLYQQDGLRLSKRVNGVLRRHVWDGGRMVLEVNAAGARLNRFMWGHELVHSYAGGWVAHNARGDVVLRTRDNGTVLGTYRYTAFGVELNPVASNTNPFRFAGEYLDFETGRYYLRARLYDPRIGRFTQPDPFWNTGNMQFGSSPVTMGHGVMRPDAWAIMQAANLFVYCMNNPVYWIDPSGLRAYSVRHGRTRYTLNVHHDWVVEGATGIAGLFVPFTGLARQGINRAFGYREIGIDWFGIGSTILDAATLAASHTVGITLSGVLTAADITHTLMTQSVQINSAIFTQFNSSIWISSSRNIVDRKFRYAVEQMGNAMTLGIIELRAAQDYLNFSARTVSIGRIDPLTGRLTNFRRGYYFFAVNDLAHGFISDLEYRIRNIR